MKLAVSIKGKKLNKSSSTNFRFSNNAINLLFISCMLFFAPLWMATAQTVHIPDSALRTALELALGKKPRADITQTDMAALESFEAFESGIRNLTGLEFATNLTELHLGLNAISDVTPLKNLTKLMVLDLHRNRRISDVTPLKNLTQLTWLSLRGNRVSDMSPLQNLTELRYLHIGYNTISDVSPLKDSITLRFLNLDANVISDVSPLKGLTNLTNLALDDNTISDVSALKNLTQLKFLNLNDNRRISDVSALKNLTQLRFLDLHGNRMLDVSPLINLTKLSNLILHSNHISDVSPLKDLTKLSRLDLHGNRISDVSALSGLTNLTVLNLSDNQISDFSPIAGLISDLVEYDNSNQTVPLIREVDVNRDGVVDVSDLVLVAFYYRNPDFAELAHFNIYPDVNGDRVIDAKDIISVAAQIDTAAAAPVLGKNPDETLRLTVANLTQWIALAKQFDIQGPHTQKGIRVLEQLLAALIVTEKLSVETALLANYPNPFNPETWIPYQLSKPAGVTVSIYSVDGKLVRTLELGQLPAGVYHNKSRAAYWNGRNELDESVASGVYFYTFTADDFAATGKMLIRK